MTTLHLPSTNLTLDLQIAQNRSYLHTSGPKVGIVYVLGAPGLRSAINVLLTYFLHALGQLFAPWQVASSASEAVWRPGFLVALDSPEPQLPYVRRFLCFETFLFLHEDLESQGSGTLRPHYQL